jgi:SAM-dependent methyltransferase
MKYQNNIKNRINARHFKSLEIIGDLSNKKILNIGCHIGWLEYLVRDKKFDEFYSIDTNLNYLDEEIKENPRFNFLQGSITNIPCRSGYFDIVTSFEIIEHLRKREFELAFNELNRVLKVGGILYISVPFKNLLSVALDPAILIGHKHLNLKILKPYLENNDFEVIYVIKLGGFYEIFNNFLMYIFRFLFNSENPFSNILEPKRNNEFFNKNNGFSNLFIKAKKYSHTKNINKI